MKSIFHNPILYFRNNKLARLDVMLRPGLAVRRGFFYSFAKFFAAMLAMNLSLTLIGHVAEPITPAAANSPFLAGLIVIPSLILAAGIAIMAIDWVDARWRAKVNTGDGNNQAVDIRAILKTYRETKAIQEYHRQIIDRILAREGELISQLPTLEDYELELIEDGFLYGIEREHIWDMDDEKHRLRRSDMAYGTKLIFFSLIAFFFLTFGMVYGLSEYLLKMAGMRDSGFIMFYVMIPVALYAMYHAMKKTDEIWARLGPFRRTMARRSIFYWPVTLLIVTGVNLWILHILGRI